MNTVLVTGAGGFVGSAVVRRLTQPRTTLWDGGQVDRVIAVIRPAGSRARLEELSADDRCTVEPVDVYDEQAFRALLRRSRPLAVVNAALDGAVFSGQPIRHVPLESAFAELGRAGGARVVHAGSAWVLAPGLSLDESAPVDPRSPYARHKFEEDELLPRLGAATGVGWIDLRLFNVFGRYEKTSRLLPHIVARLSRGERAALSHGDQVRDFNDVDDIAEAFALALRAPGSACGALYHIGSARATTVREFASAVASVVATEDLIGFGVRDTADGDVPALVADCSLARRELGWEPAASLDDRIRAAVEWWLARPAATDSLERRPQELPL